MNVFNKVLIERPKRSTFDLSHDVKLSFKMGDLIPVNCIECIPGDSFKISTEAMLRLMPMIAPIMHKVNFTVHHFFVPNRIVWPNFENFMFPQSVDGTPPVFPTMMFDVPGYQDVTAGTLADYLGLPLGNYAGIGGTTPISAIPFAGYQRIWAEWYRDQNVSEYENAAKEFTLTDGQQFAEMVKWTPLRKRAWQHDYFTSALPWAQKGEAIEFPLDLTGDLNVYLSDTPGFGMVRDATDHSINVNGGLIAEGVPNEGEFTALGWGAAAYDPNGTLYVDGEQLSSTTTINDLRTATALQKWLEKNARGGTRFIEGIKVHFGVTSSDKRLQRPEYLGGSRSSMAISEVLQTSSSDATTPQGNMAGHGISVTDGRNNSYFVEEHGYIFTIINVQPTTAYMQGLPRHFTKFDRLDYYFPDFAFLGEQEIKNKEIYLDFNTATEQNEGTFGYIPRYSEYRYLPSRAAGQMRTTLAHWHMAREFDERPTLSPEFIYANPTKRIFAVTDPTEDEIVGHLYHKIFASRLMPKYGNPGSF